ncbi:MAG: hypothetical protein K2X27_10540 [Candidatus Obscuribacterales bacterium]|nr:hypothetical protein [Candidatus Obscuribacterales bacterium]
MIFNGNPRPLTYVDVEGPSWFVCVRGALIASALFLAPFFWMLKDFTLGMPVEPGPHMEHPFPVATWLFTFLFSGGFLGTVVFVFLHAVHKNRL